MPDQPPDALLLVSFGGPEGPADVLPFLRAVTRGRGIPDERLAEVGAHYALFGGVSPLNGQNRALAAALREVLDLPVYWGNRNWPPLLADALIEMRDEGIQHALAFVTSAYGSYSGCRQYLDDIARARAEVTGAPEVTKLRLFFNHPVFVSAIVDNVRTVLAAEARLVFVAHSIPLSMASTSRYVAQLGETCRLVAEAVGRDDWDLVWSSRSGAPGTPWLEPDIGEHLAALDAPAVCVVPVGFVSDHMEVVYDLDVVAAQVARDRGMRWARSSTPGLALVPLVAELVREHTDGLAPRWSGSMGLVPEQCAPGCCPAPGGPTEPSRP